MNMTSSIPLLDAGAVSPPDQKPAKLAEAARQFEALMIGELLKSAAGDKASWLGDDADDASETAMGMAQTQLAQAMASRGGFGLASTIERAMTKPEAATPGASAARLYEEPGETVARSVTI
jgi:Rod binding domain-containing protein